MRNVNGKCINEAAHVSAPDIFHSFIFISHSSFLISNLI